MSTNKNVTDFKDKGLGYVTDSLDEGDYDLYKAIAQESEKFITVNVYRTLQLHLRSTKVPTLKHLLDIFYHKNLNILKKTKLNEPKGPQSEVPSPASGDDTKLAERVMEGIWIGINESKGPQSEVPSSASGDDTKLAEKVMEGIWTGIIKHIIRSLKKQDTSYMKMIENYEIRFSEEKFNDLVKALEEESNSQGVSQKALSFLQERQKATPNREKDLTTPLGFFENPSKSINWKIEDEFDHILSFLTMGFQEWITNNSKLKKELPHESIEPNGIAGFDTYIGIIVWMLSEDARSRFFQHILISFPTSLPKKVIHAIFEELLKGINERYLRQNSNEVIHLSEEDIEKISQEYFFIIGPIFAVIFQILGPIGAYPRALDIALETAVGRFFSLLCNKPETDSRAPRLIEFSEVFSLK